MSTLKIFTLTNVNSQHLCSCIAYIDLIENHFVCHIGLKELIPYSFLLTDFRVTSHMDLHSKFTSLCETCTHIYLFVCKQIFHNMIVDLDLLSHEINLLDS